jgi:hypothetical protein
MQKAPWAAGGLIRETSVLVKREEWFGGHIARDPDQPVFIDQT